MSVDTLPQRLDNIYTKLDWGLSDTCQLTLQLHNGSNESWRSVSADGGCTCLTITTDEVPKTGVAPGEFLIAKAVYSKPKKPGISPRTIRFNLNNSVATLPVIVDWRAPLELQRLTQIKPNEWRLEGRCGEGWTFQSIDAVDDDITVRSQQTNGLRFAIHMESTLTINRNTRLVCKVSPRNGTESVEQVLTIALENAEPRSIPNRLICHLNTEGVLTGETRLLFPRARQSSRPNVVRCVLVASNGSNIPLAVAQSALGRTALLVDFSSESGVNESILNENSTIRFMFDDESQLDCQFLISME